MVKQEEVGALTHEVTDTLSRVQRALSDLEDLQSEHRLVLAELTARKEAMDAAGFFRCEECGAFFKGFPHPTHKKHFVCNKDRNGNPQCDECAEREEHDEARRASQAGGFGGQD